MAETHGSGGIITLALPSASRIDHVVMQEDCSQGERVRSYRLEARSSGSWKAVGTGSAIGHKRIQPIDPTVADAIRLTATERAAEPQIRRLAVFNTNSLPPLMWNAARWGTG
jgi:alpha-L-fucosidase